MIEVESHPPERRRRSTVLMVHGCCCCCCLHVIGGLAGAAWGSVRRKAPLPETLATEAAIRAEEDLKTANRFAAKVYWLALALLGLLAAAAAVLVDPNDSTVSLFGVGFCLPVGQLVASGAAWIVIQTRPPVRKTECLSRLGKITLYGFLGGLIGCVGVVISFFTILR
jgi:hypothetical protein